MKPTNEPRPYTDAEIAKLRERPMRPDGIKARLLATIDKLKKAEQDDKTV